MIAVIDAGAIITWAISLTLLLLAIIGAGVVVRRATVTFLVTTLEKTVDALKEAAEANEKQKQALRDEIMALERTKAALQGALDAEQTRSKRIENLLTECSLKLDEATEKLASYQRTPRKPRPTT